MKKIFWIVFIIALVVVPLMMFGCKGKAEKPAETTLENTGEVVSTEATVATQPQEPAKEVAVETIPPTAAPQITEKKVAVLQEPQDKNKDIQKALKSAGFYTGAIDGKIGPKTKKAIEEFQRAKGLKADGKVGPKTWAELEKYLIQ